MTPTREQYELAAKAAGIELNWIHDDLPYPQSKNVLVYAYPWRPHEDNAQAFSLLCAIRGGLDFVLGPRHWAVWSDGLYAAGYEERMLIPCVDDSQQGIEAAACEAIFLCAVEVGRGMV